MPISPDKMKLYPGGSIRSPEWLAIRERIRARAGDKCEECAVPNGAWRNNVTDEVTTDPFRVVEWDEPYAKIVCTTAHLDGELHDHSDANLRFWCQRCHNRHDAKSRRVNAGVTIRKRGGQGDLFA
jgi:hypothetical protein